MTRGLAPGRGPQCSAPDARARGGDGGRIAARLPEAPAPLRFRSRASYAKDDIFGLCDALARAERALIRAGEPAEAARLSGAFDLLEGGLV